VCESRHRHLPVRRGGPPVTARLAAALAAVLWLAPAAAQTALTLPEALRRAAQNSLPADTARLDVSVAKEQTAEIKTSYYPLVTLDGGHLSLDNQPTFVSGPIAFPSANKNSWQYNLSVREILWDGGRRSTAVAASKTREAAVELKGASEVRKTQATVADRYVTALGLRAEREVLDLRKKALEDHLREVKDLFDQGMVARNDLLRTEVALRAVGDAQANLDNACATSLEALNKELGLDPTTPQVLPEGLPDPPPITWSEGECRSRAEDHNEGVMALAQKVKGLEQTVQFRRKDYYPKVVAEAAASYTQNQYLLYPYVNSLFVGLSMDVFDGGARASRIKQAEAEAEKARRELEEAKRGVSVTVGQSLRDYQEALKQVETARANVTASDENLRIIEDQYKEGLARTTDVLDAVSVLAESRWQVVQMHYRAYARQAALLAAMGEDLPTFYENGLVAPAKEK
jgi:outer membrane protein